MTTNIPPPNGGPAFPNEGGAGHLWNDKGMTLRDYFAAKAMPWFMEAAFRIQDDGRRSWQQVAADASYEQADAMLVARGRQ